MIDRYDFRFMARFMIGGVGSFVAMAACMKYGPEPSGEGRTSAWLVVEPFATPLWFYALYRLRPFREYRAGLRLELPGWDWTGDVATAFLSAAASAVVWLGAVLTLSRKGMFPAPGGLAFWSLMAALIAATWLLCWTICKPAGLLTAPVKPGYGR